MCASSFGRRRSTSEVVNLERQFCNMQRPIVALILNFAKPIPSCLQLSRDKQKYIRLDLTIKSRLEYEFQGLS